jgi:hypothetical protein
MAGPDISQTQIYEWLTGDENTRMCDDIPDSACKDQPQNFMRHLWASLGNKLADELSSARLVLPWLMGVIGAPVWMVGLLVPIRESGALLPQVFVAGFIRLKPQRKWVWVAGGLLQALSALALALLALLGKGTLGGALVLASLVALSLARGLSSIATKDVMGKTIAKKRRGNLMGWSGSVAGAATLLAGGVLMLFEDRPGQLALAILLGIAALGWALNAFCAARIQESPGAIDGGENAWDSLKLGLSLLKEDRTFLHFNLARALLLSSALALPYIALLGQQQSGARDDPLQPFTLLPLRQAQGTDQRPGAGQATPAQPSLLAPLAKMLGERTGGRFAISPIALRSVLDGIGARLSESREITRYLIGLLIFLGLLGTFWGLLRTIGAVSEVIAGLSVESGDLARVFADLQTGLEAPLGGMATAFSSSLFGLGGSLALGFLELQSSQAQNRFYNELEDWLSGAVRLGDGGAETGGPGAEAALMPSIPAYMQALMQQTAENLDALERTVALGEESRRQTNQTLAQLVERLADLDQHLRAQQTTVSTLAQAVEGGQLGIDDETRRHLRNLDAGIERLREDAATGRDRAVHEIRSEIKVLARTIAALAEDAEP